MTRAPSFSPFASPGCSPSRSPFRPRDLSRRWLSAALCAFGLLYGAAMIYGEATFKAGLATGSLSGILKATVQAEAIFPSSLRLREALAMTSSQMAQVDPILALGFVKSAQRHAPHDPVLWYWRAVSHLRAGDGPSARDALAKMQALAPGWPETQRLARYMQENVK